jgi:hypothetical protein
MQSAYSACYHTASQHYHLLQIATARSERAREMTQFGVQIRSSDPNSWSVVLSGLYAPCEGATLRTHSMRPRMLKHRLVRRAEGAARRLIRVLRSYRAGVLTGASRGPVPRLQEARRDRGATHTPEGRLIRRTVGPSIRSAFACPSMRRGQPGPSPSAQRCRQRPLDQTRLSPRKSTASENRLAADDSGQRARAGRACSGPAR